MKEQLIVKADKDVKAKAQRIAKEMGLPLSTVINAYLKEFVRNQVVTFALEPEPRPEVARLLKQASSDYKKGKNISGPFSTPREIKTYLDSL